MAMSLNANSLRTVKLGQTSEVRARPTSVPAARRSVAVRAQAQQQNEQVTYRWRPFQLSAAGLLDREGSLAT